MKRGLVILATSNEGKINDFKERMILLNYDITPLADMNIPESPESKDSTEGNSLQKMEFYRDEIYSRYPDYKGSYIISEDTGLFIESLNGDPGVKTARFTGVHDDDATNKKIIKLLNGIENRSAIFKTSMSLGIIGKSSKLTISDELKGSISTEIREGNGFAFDYIFIPDGYSETLSELPKFTRLELVPRSELMDYLEILMNDKIFKTL